MDQIFNHLPALFITAFLAILFLQSGLDKVLDYRGNLQYFTEHFKGSPLANSVPLLMPTITLLEMLAGIVSALAFLQTLISGQSSLAIYSPFLAGLALLCLFFGQRVGKDYVGAAVLVPYFIVVILGFWLIK